MLEVIEEVEHGKLREAPLPSRSAVVRGLVVLVMLGALLPSVLGLLGRWGWLLDLCNHFRFQFAVVLLATTVGLLLLRSWRMGAVSLTGLVLNLVFVLPLYVGASGAVDAGQPAMTVMHFNVNTGNSNEAGVIAEIRAYRPGLLFVQEVNQNWLDALEAGLKDYKLIASEPRTDNFGIACFVRINGGIMITDARVFDPTGGYAQVPAIEVAFEFDRQPARALSIHALPPISLPYARVRDAVLDASGQWSAAQTVPHLIVGDFNATPWSTAFRDMQSAGELTNSQIGFGRAATWPAGLGSLGMIPIDHLLHSESWVTIDRTIGEAKGSDHHPLVVELALRK